MFPPAAAPARPSLARLVVGPAVAALTATLAALGGGRAAVAWLAPDVPPGDDGPVVDMVELAAVSLVAIAAFLGGAVVVGLVVWVVAAVVAARLVFPPGRRAVPAWLGALAGLVLAGVVVAVAVPAGLTLEVVLVLCGVALAVGTTAAWVAWDRHRLRPPDTEIALPR